MMQVVKKILEYIFICLIGIVILSVVIIISLFVVRLLENIFVLQSIWWWQKIKFALLAIVAWSLFFFISLLFVKEKNTPNDYTYNKDLTVSKRWYIIEDERTNYFVVILKDVLIGLISFGIAAVGVVISLGVCQIFENIFNLTSVTWWHSIKFIIIVIIGFIMFVFPSVLFLNNRSK